MKPTRIILAILELMIIVVGPSLLVAALTQRSTDAAYIKRITEETAEQEKHTEILRELGETADEREARYHAKLDRVLDKLDRQLDEHGR